MLDKGYPETKKVLHLLILNCKLQLQTTSINDQSYFTMLTNINMDKIYSNKLIEDIFMISECVELLSSMF